MGKSINTKQNNKNSNRKDDHGEMRRTGEHIN